MNSKVVLSVLWMTFFGLLIFAQPAHAYIDPGTGSMVLQLVLAGLAGVGLALKVFWKRLSALFSKKDKGHDGLAED
jgi:hypothetical protein